MSLFKTNPEIFCNGKFRFRSGSGNTFDLVGVSNKQYYPEDRCLLCYNFSGQIIEKDVSDCTLIARPIESMTDEEIYRLTGLNPDQQDYQAEEGLLVETIEEDLDTTEGLLYALSMGIYPGPQSDFDNGDVIRREG